MKNTDEKNYTNGSSISPETLTDIAAGFENYIAYKLPMFKNDYRMFLQDPLGKILSGKREFLNKSIEEIITLIKEREQLRDRNIYKIDIDICKINTVMLNLPGQRYSIDVDTDTINDTLQKQVMTLNKEKRAEEVACWRDITRLKSDLKDSLKELAQEKRKQSLLSGKAG